MWIKISSCSNIPSSLPHFFLLLLLQWDQLQIYSLTHNLCAILQSCCLLQGFPGGSVVKNGLPMQETQEIQVQSLGWEDPLGKGMTTHSNILAWKMPWTKDPGGLQSMGLQRVWHGWRDLEFMHAPYLSQKTSLIMWCLNNEQEKVRW